MLTKSEQLAAGNWARGLGVASAMLLVIGLLYYGSGVYWHGGWLRDVQGYVLGRDFLNFWMMGRHAFAPDAASYYNHATYSAALEAMLGGQYQQVASYPPTLWLMAVPFGALPYLWAYALWTGLGVFALWRALRLVGGHSLDWVMVSPVLLLALVCGQSSLLTAAGMLAAYHWRASRPMLAGVLLGLLTVKPQLGVLFPLLLIAGRHWRCFAVAVASAILLMAVTYLAFGAEPFRAYIMLAMADQSAQLVGASMEMRALMPTMYMSVRLLGGAAELAMLVQAIVSVVVAVVAYRLFRVCKNAAQHFAIFAIASVLMTPYLMGYDLLPVMVACFWLNRDLMLNARERGLLTALYLVLPLQILSALVSLPLGCAVLVVALLWLWRRNACA